MKRANEQLHGSNPFRGNHESAPINRNYGFYDECKKRYDIRLWKVYQEVFNCMPFCGRVGGRIFCMHGGISPELHSWDQLARVERPCDIPDYGLATDLLWADPDPSVRG